LIYAVFRQTNIALLQQYGSNAWRVHNYILEANTTQVEKAVEDLKQLTTDVNRERKNLQVRKQIDSGNATYVSLQTGLGAQLTSLETRWTELISNMLQIEMANVALEAELERLTKREAELAAM
jgi:pre-mRNA-splicing factor SPF27